MSRKYIKRFRVLTAAGRTVAHADTIEAAEFKAMQGRGRYIVEWSSFSGRYVFRSQF